MNFSQLLQLNGWCPDDTLTLNYLESGKWRTIATTAAAAQGTVDAMLTGRDAWYSVCPLRSDFQSARAVGSRGTIEDVVGLRALWTDLDIKPDGLPSMDAALDVIGALSERLGRQPSARVGSGHGIHAYWALVDPPTWEPGDLERRARAKTQVARWGRLVQQEARKVGGKVDNVYELARVLRVPGTSNLKGA